MLCRVRTLLEIEAIFAGQPSAAEATSILAKIAAPLVEQVRRYMGSPRLWSVLSLAQTAQALGITGHKTLYDYLALSAHGCYVGYHMTETAGRDDLRMLRFKSKATPRDKAALANFCRRFLHRAYGEIARDWLGEVPQVQTPNPFGSTLAPDLPS